MKTNDILNLQSYLDGELSPRETARVAAWLAQDPQAAALLGELKSTKETLTSNEPVMILPEAREFHWSRIAREIERSESQPAWVRRATSPAWWLRYFSPAAVVAVLAAVLVLQPASDDADAEAQTAPAPETSPVVFRSQAEGMTVIWLQGDENNEFANPEGDF